MNAGFQPESVVTVDCHYRYLSKAAAYLVVEGDRAAFVDNNTVHAVPNLMAALSARGLRSENVEYLIITHVHLDHAGATATLTQRCPNAKVLAHPKAARHIVDPSRLIAGAKAVYGEDAFYRLYGDIEGVDEGRVRVMEDGEELVWGGRTLRFFYTLGHASHHFCIYDSATNGVFTGDAFGLGLNESVRPGASFLVCTTAPTDFDAAEARKSVRRIVDTGAERAYLPHFGMHVGLASGAEQLYRYLDRMEAILETAREIAHDAVSAFCSERVASATKEHLRECGVADVAADLRWLGDDVEINAMGLAYCVKRRRSAR